MRSVGDVTRDGGVDVDGVFGAQVRAARESLGWSQARLATEIGLDAYGVSRLEGGRKKLGLSESVRIANVLGVSLDRLMTPVDDRAALTQALDAADEAVLRARSSVVVAMESVARVAGLAQRTDDAVVAEVLGAAGDSDVVDSLTERVARVSASGDRAAVGDGIANAVPMWVAALGERIVS